MTPRTIHIGASFAIVLVAYWTYALLAVPWIEPPPPPPSIDEQNGTSGTCSQANELAVLFPPDAWQLHDAKIINSNGQALLLWQKYQNHGNGWVDLTPLTVIFMPDETETDRGRALAARRGDGSAGGREPAFRPAAGPEQGRHRAADRGQASRAGADPQPRQAAGPSRRLAGADPRR